MSLSQSFCAFVDVFFLMLSENLVEDLLSDFEFEIQVPYLLYRNAAQEVNGIWFYNTVECEEVANLFTRYYLIPSLSRLAVTLTLLAPCCLFSVLDLYRRFVR